MRRESRREMLMEGALAASAVFSSAVVLSILFLLVYFSLPLFEKSRIVAVFSPHWKPFHDQCGILPMIVASFLLATFSLLLAYPVALGICCFSLGTGTRRLGRFVLGLVHFMTSIPTVVYGFVSVFLLVPLIRKYIGGGTGYCLLSAMVTLSILILPTIVLLINSDLQQVDADVISTTTALGFTPTQRFLWITLPGASRGLVAGAVLGFGRAVGDTLISLMLAGNAPQIPESFLDSVRTLTAHIALVVSTDSHSAAYQSLFAAGLILFLITAAINVTISWIGSSAGKRAG